MQKNTLQEATGFLARNRRRRVWNRVVGVLACIVVFATIYALILPAITMEKTPVCGKEEHTHSDACFVQETSVIQKELSCAAELHQHTDNCHNDIKDLVCGYADYVIHQHDSACYDENGSLCCTLPEIEPHIHTDSCYAKPKDEPMDIADSSYAESEDEMTDADGDQTVEPVCGEMQVLEHQHTDECFQTVEETTETSSETPNCGLEEHIHDSSCFSSSAPAEHAARQEDGGIMFSAKGAEAPVHLPEYVEAQNGTFAITISKDGNILQPGEDGSYEVTAGETYNIRIAGTGMESLNPGQYYVSFPSNVDISQTGRLTFKDNHGQEIEAGTWHFEKQEDGTVWMIFDISEDMARYSNVDLVADVTWKVDYTEQPVEFDGNITVHIRKPEGEHRNTETTKWAKGWGAGESDSTEGVRIQWRSEIYGYSDSHIVGSVITDTAVTDTHYFSQEDMENGIRITASYYGDRPITSEYQAYYSYSWYVRDGDPGLIWTENGWAYTMPEKVPSGSHAGEDLGDAGWYYYLRYTSTVRQPPVEGIVITYENKISADGSEATGKIKSGVITGSAGIDKTGIYNSGSDASVTDDDTVDWTITVTIPGAGEGQKYDVGWHIWDTLRLLYSNEEIKYPNPLDDAVMTATIGGETFYVPQYNVDAGEGDRLCWRAYTSGTNGYGKEICLYCPCTCTEETCQAWTNGRCGRKHGNGTFCECWNLPEAAITFTYSTPAKDLIDNYGGVGARIRNNVGLNRYQMEDGELKSIRIDNGRAEVPIPGIFTKQQTGDPTEDNGYLAQYTVTVNETKADLSVFQEITITDTMTKTLNFLSDTLVIQAEGTDGSVWPLTAGTDYTFAYENQDTQNVLTIILNASALGPYQYTLIYDASVAGGGGLGTSYENRASIDLGGKTYEVSGGIHEVPKAAITAETYKVTLYKYAAGEENKPLSGAEFGLFTENGRRIKTYTTQGNGTITMQTDPSSGVVFHEHVLYYVQELKEPEGYLLDDTKHYFWFCNGISPCESHQCSSQTNYQDEYPNAIPILAGVSTIESGLRIPNEKKQTGHELPATGGPGTTPYTIGGLLLTAAGSILLYSKKKRKKEDYTSF